MKRKFLAALLALVMVFSMIPVSASAAEVTGNKGIVKLDYNDSGAIDKTIKVVVQYNNQILDEYEVNNSRVADQKITLSLIGDYANTYDIESVSVDTPGAHSSTVHYLHKDSYECRLSLAGSKDTPATFTVTLCDPLETPDIEGGEIDPGINSIEYRAFDHDMLKLLYVNGVKEVDENTEINDVKMHFVESYQVDTHEQSLLNFKTAGNQVDYHYYTLSDVSDGKGIPGNIRYIEITYTLDGAEESKTLRVYSGDLRYVNKSEAGGNYRIYNIEAYNDNTSIVAFYYEAGAELTTWSLYDVRFVDTGTALGSENMPADPTYGDGNKYIFTNWDKNVGGGDPFLPYEKVEDDTVVYAQKTSTPDRGGTEIHVMNTDNELANRIMEIYNAENGTQLGSDSIDMNSVTIYATSKDGSTSTNPDYWNNGWRPLTGGNRYYRVINSDIAGNHPTISNDHIAHNDIGSITITATVNGTSFTVTLPVDEAAPGAVSVSSVQDNIIEISVNGAPDAPTDDELTGDTGLLKEGAVKVICTNEEATHLLEEQTYGLLDGYTLSDVQWTGAGETGYYYVDITVPAAGYVTKFSTDSGADHALAPDAADTDTIRLQYANEGWKVMENETPVTFEVTCTTEPGGGDEDEPEAPTSDVFKDLISVLCVDNIHESKKYGLLDNGFKFPDEGVVKTGDTYSYTVTIYPDVYADTYSDEIGIAHSLISDRGLSITATYDMDKGQWNTPSPVTIEVECDSGTTEPEDPEKPTLSEDDVVTMLGTNAIAVKCIDDKHIPQYHPLENTIVSLGNVTGSKEAGYQCEVTVTLGIGNLSSYLADYNEFTTPQKHSLMSMDTITRTITLKCEPNDEVDWYFPGECPIITIDVTCASGETTIPAPDDETVNNLLGKAVIIDCTNDEANHENEAFSLIEDTYQIGEVYMADGIPHCDVTITAPDKYAAQYSYNTKTNHPLAPADQVSQAITLKYVKDEWAIDDDGTVYYTVACEDTSTEPTPTPTPTPDPGDDNNPPYIPPYIPPVDPDDSGVSDLLNTDDHIQYLFGYPEGTFGPENNMTRAEVAQMFYNLLLDQDVTITKTFDDVPANAWYAKAVNTLASLGVVSGVGNGDFEPERSITRAEFTSIAMKFAEGKTGGTNIFSDVKSTDWFYRAVVNSTQYGWIHGYGDGTFRPNNPITRVEVTAIVNNMLGREADVDFVTEHYDELNHFSDLAVSHWGYYHIVEATNDHDYTKPSSGENWTELN